MRVAVSGKPSKIRSEDTPSRFLRSDGVFFLPLKRLKKDYYLLPLFRAIIATTNKPNVKIHVSDSKVTV